MSIAEQESVTEVKIGDTVRLKSGSPPLRIVAKSSDGMVTVAWAKEMTLPMACVHASDDKD